jgi:hypothetical protein
MLQRTFIKLLHDSGKYTRKVRGCSESLFISLNDVKDALKEVQLIVVKALIDVSFSLCA